MRFNTTKQAVTECQTYEEFKNLIQVLDFPEKNEAIAHRCEIEITTAVDTLANQFFIGQECKIFHLANARPIEEQHLVWSERINATATFNNAQGTIPGKNSEIFYFTNTQFLDVYKRVERWIQSSQLPFQSQIEETLVVDDCNDAWVPVCFATTYIRTTFDTPTITQEEGER